ncbi:rCG22155 [Rattus norvegicus]|uniref:RCG22155 n=1 Tax=Rattus norvegicus TaxID=10116 RepID=A6IN91_RAT|nr:rCG22155 [Rattus norvegicus]
MWALFETVSRTEAQANLEFVASLLLQPPANAGFRRSHNAPPKNILNPNGGDFVVLYSKM